MSKTPALRVLVVDDEPAIRDILELELERMGHTVTCCESGEAAVAAIGGKPFDAALLDLRMPGMDGWAVADHLREHSPDTKFVICTGHGDMPEAITAVRKGAFDFVQKPPKLAEISDILSRIADLRNAEKKVEALTTRLKAVEGKTDLIGSTPSMERVKRMIAKVAPSDAAVLVLGETGTGKEVVAKAIHDQSNRAGGPFIPVNCGALPENLVESEFFGHRKGAFTGADQPRKGLLEVADGGTLFLDELGELDKGMQVKLLRFLESSEIRRVGENETFKVDVRIVCATNRDLAEMAQEGTFREDLIFRVNTFEIHLPPLRERRPDIPELARFLIARHLKRDDVPADILGKATLDALCAYDWQGNVRELANALEHAVILADGAITPDDLPASVTRRAVAGSVRLAALPDPDEYPNPGTPDPVTGEVKTLREIEKDVILATLDKNEGDKPSTAKELGIALKTLYNKLNSYEAKRAAG